MRNLNVDRNEPPFRCNPQAGTWLQFRLHTLHARYSFCTLATTRHTSLYGTQTTTVRILSKMTVTLPFCTPWKHMGEWMYSFTNFNFGIKWGWDAIFTLRLLYLPGKPLYPLNRRLGGIHSRSRLFGDEIINLLFLKVNEDPSYFRPVVDSLYQNSVPASYIEEHSDLAKACASLCKLYSLYF